MGEHSKIEWTDHTFNTWWGCQKVSPACKNCYAESFAGRFFDGLWGPGHEIRTFGAKHWNDPLRWDRRAAKDGVRRRVFCGSMCDVFEGVDDESSEQWLTLARLRERLWQLIEATPNIDWLLLTKRPENVLGMVPLRWRGGCSGYVTDDEEEDLGGKLDLNKSCGGPGSPGWKHDGFGSCYHCDAELFAGTWPANVWMGVTVENQQAADERIPELLKIPARVRFLSCEPLLGPVDLLYASFNLSDSFGSMTGIDWVIAGGESGPKARPSRPDWFRSLRDQCDQAGTSFLFKQWGEFAPETRQDALDQALTDEAGPLSSMVRRVGKKAAGRILDGRTWDGVPLGHLGINTEEPGR